MPYLLLFLILSFPVFGQGVFLQPSTFPEGKKILKVLTADGQWKEQDTSKADELQKNTGIKDGKAVSFQAIKQDGQKVEMATFQNKQDMKDKKVPTTFMPYEKSTDKFEVSTFKKDKK